MDGLVGVLEVAATPPEVHDQKAAAQDAHDELGRTSLPIRSAGRHADDGSHRVRVRSTPLSMMPRSIGNRINSMSLNDAAAP
jgi:hypothetical protein